MITVFRKWDTSVEIIISFVNFRADREEACWRLEPRFCSDKRVCVFVWCTILFVSIVYSLCCDVHLQSNDFFFKYLSLNYYLYILEIVISKT